MNAPNIEPRIPFTEEEYKRIMLPNEVGIPPKKGKIVDDLSNWQSKKATYGMIRLDLTKDLPKTDEGFAIVEAYTGLFPTDLVDIGKLGKSTKFGAWSNGFSDDYTLDRVYHRPAEYFNKIPNGEVLWHRIFLLSSI